MAQLVKCLVVGWDGVVQSESHASGTGERPESSQLQALWNPGYLYSKVSGSKGLGPFLFCADLFLDEHLLREVHLWVSAFKLVWLPLPCIKWPKEFMGRNMG